MLSDNQMEEVPLSLLFLRPLRLKIEGNPLKDKEQQAYIKRNGSLALIRQGISLLAT